jgi:hypothetical protein
MFQVHDIIYYVSTIFIFIFNSHNTAIYLITNHITTIQIKISELEIVITFAEIRHLTNTMIIFVIL